MQIPTAILPAGPRPPTWQLVLAFAVVYFGYGLNFLAVKVGVETLPAFLFAGAHVMLAGLLLFAWRGFRRLPLLLSPSGLAKAAGAALFLFVGGVGLVTEGEKLGVASGQAAMIKASVPLWIAIFEAIRPRGEKPTGLMTIGLLLGGAGVVLLVLPNLANPAPGGEMLGTVLLLLSALLFAIGTLLVRHLPPSNDTTGNVSWMMLLGGGYLVLLGFSLGEAKEISTSDFTLPVLSAFLFLLFVHSLAAFSAMNWLLRHLPASVVTTKFYVSPAIAAVAGWLVLNETLALPALGGLALILAGVTLVMAGEKLRHATPALRPDDADELED